MTSEEKEIPVEEGLDNIINTDNVKNNVLDSTMVAQGLKTLGVHPLEHRHTFLELSLTGLSLEFIDILSNYKKIMYLDISNNNIKSLKPLEKMTCLIHLNARNNQITECLDFAPPLCNEQCAWKDGHRAVGSMLTLVDLSHNKIQKIGDLRRHQFLECLLLNHNQISKIEGVDTLEYLQTLDLSNNQIATIEGLNNLPIRELRLAHNKIQELTGLNELHNLSSLDMSYNFISNLIPLQDCIQLCYLDVSHNLIPYIRNVEFLYEITWLQILILYDNPCQQKEHYRLRVLYRLPNLTRLDHTNVSYEEKIRAYNLYDAPQGDLSIRKELFQRFHETIPFVDYSPQQLTYDDEQDIVITPDSILVAPPMSTSIF